MPRLSICIPTYNRVAYLEELLVSIINQVTSDSIEVVISDNASTDNTEVVVKGYQSRFSWIKYHKTRDNHGADKNFLKVIDLAEGEYCWLVGSDDIVPSGALADVLKIIVDDDVYLIDRFEATINLTITGRRKWLNTVNGSVRFNFSKHEDVVAYFKACRSLGGVFSYLSSIIVRRSSWKAHDIASEIIGTNYSHVYIVLSMLLKGGSILYVQKPLVIFRSGNDSFKKDLVQRALIDLVGYEKIGRLLIRNPFERDLFWRIMHIEHTVWSIIKCKGASGWEKWAEYKYYAHSVFGFRWYTTFLAEILFPITRMAYLIRNKIRQHV